MCNLVERSKKLHQYQSTWQKHTILLCWGVHCNQRLLWKKWVWSGFILTWWKPYIHQDLVWNPWGQAHNCEGEQMIEAHLKKHTWNSVLYIHVHRSSTIMNATKFKSKIVCLRSAPCYLVNNHSTRQISSKNTIDYLHLSAFHPFWFLFKEFINLTIFMA